MINPICEGCFMVRRASYSFCLFREYGETEVCPCSKCLVKVMCQRQCVIRLEKLLLVRREGSENFTYS